MKRAKETVLAVGVALALLAIPIIQRVALGAEGLKWVGCGISKKAFMGPLAAAYEKKTGVKIKLEGGGATRGIVDVVEGKADLGGTCRHVLPRQEERGVKLIPLGWDALVVLVHPSNTVKNLNLDQLKDIYTGKTTNWKQVGGADRKILVVARSGKISGVGRMFRELVFKNPEQEFTPAARIVEESAGVEQVVEKDQGAIAVSGVSSSQKRAVKLVQVNGKAPTDENIKDGSYLLYRPLYLVVKQQASDEVGKFVAFALSDAGQTVIAGEGTVNLKEGARLWALYSRQMKEAGVTPGSF
ncbi:MAG TPA: phosphate ABC transporter substrate-binding protein [Nitrospirota bacterium]|nr:phosphate ABC transporter substrate-binding protein [Nitrospirota bacterium]